MLPRVLPFYGHRKSADFAEILGPRSALVFGLIGLGAQRAQYPLIKEYLGFLKGLLKGSYRGSIREVRNIA